MTGFVVFDCMGLVGAADAAYGGDATAAGVVADAAPVHDRIC